MGSLLKNKIIKTKNILIIFALISFIIIPYLPLAWRGVICIILVGLGAYLKQVKGGFVGALWSIFILEFWGSLAKFNYFALLGEGLIFGALFKYQFTLKENLKEKNKSLEQEQEMFSKMLETTLNGFYILNKKGDFIKANYAYQKMVGYSEEELLKMNIDDIKIDKDQEIEEHIKRIIEVKKDKFESRYQCKAGEFIDVEISTTYLPGVNNGVFVVFAEDITKRKEREKRLKESEAKFKSYINNAPYGIFVTNKQGEYIELNPKALELSGYSKEDILGKKIGTVKGIMEEEKGKRKFAELVKKGKVSSEFLFTKKIIVKLMLK